MKPEARAATNRGSVALIASRGPVLGNLPIGLFGSALGVLGLSVAWRLAHARYGASEQVALVIAAVAVIAFALMVAGYAIKLVTAFGAVREEFRHPVAGNLFGTVLISLLQFPIIIEPIAHRLAQITWIAGVAGMSLFAWRIVGRWISDRRLATQATPASMIPVAGVLYVPVALPELGLPHLHGVMVAALGIGLFLTLQLFTLILARLLSEPPLPDALKPSLLAVVAPFAVGYSTYTVTTGRADLFSDELFMVTLFLLVILVRELRHVPLSCPFHVSWWSVSFPLASSSIAALRFADARPSVFADLVAIALLALATIVIAGLLARTLLDIGRAGFPDGYVSR